MLMQQGASGKDVCVRSGAGVPWVKACCTGSGTRLAPLLDTLVSPALVTIRQRLHNVVHRSGIHARVEVPPGMQLPGQFWLAAGAGVPVQRRG